MCIYYTIYKTTNTKNGKIYIGQHKTKDPNDRYLGSGMVLLRAIAQHGRKNFKKEVLFIFDNYEEMEAMEKSLVNEEFVKSDSNYNMATGGSFGKKFSEETKKKLSFIAKNRKYSAETRAKLSEAQKGRKHSEETKKKIGRKGRVFTEQWRANLSKAHKNPSEETRKKISAAGKGRKHSEETKAKMRLAHLLRRNKAKLQLM